MEGKVRAWGAVIGLGILLLGAGCVGSLAIQAPLYQESLQPVVAAAFPPEVPVDGGPARVDPVPTATASATPRPPSPTVAPTATPSPTATTAPTPTPEPTPTPIPPHLRRPADTVPILMYHYIRVNPDPADKIGYGLSVTPEDFAAQMAFLARRGYRTVDLGQLGSAEAGEGRTVVITFDDGYADAFEQAAPVLDRYGFKATFYLITGLAGAPGYLSWDQARALADAGHTIGAHTIGHPDLRLLKLASLKRQVEESRAELERQLGRPVLDFSYPSGKYDADVLAAVAAAGYRSAVTVRGGIYSPGDDPLLLSRVRVYGGMSLSAFADAIGEAAP